MSSHFDYLDYGKLFTTDKEALLNYISDNHERIEQSISNVIDSIKADLDLKDEQREAALRLMEKFKGEIFLPTITKDTFNAIIAAGAITKGKSLVQQLVAKTVKEITSFEAS